MPRFTTSPVKPPALRSSGTRIIGPAVCAPFVLEYQNRGVCAIKLRRVMQFPTNFYLKNAEGAEGVEGGGGGGAGRKCPISMAALMDGYGGGGGGAGRKCQMSMAALMDGYLVPSTSICKTVYFSQFGQAELSARQSKMGFSVSFFWSACKAPKVRKRERRSMG